MSRARSSSTPNEDFYPSWVLLAVTKTMNLEDVRQHILTKNLGKIPGVVYGRSIEMDWDDVKEVDNYIDMLVREKGQKTYLFSVANLPNKETGETHWQTFILNKRNKILWGFDPAGEDLYAADAANVYVFPSVQKHKYETRWCHPSTACQTTDRDVFCQSWSLWLQIEAMKTQACGTERSIKVAKGQDARWALILKFWKNSLKGDQWLCSKLETVYEILIKEHSEPKEWPLWEGELLRVDPCLMLQNLTLKDLKEWRNV